MPISLVVIIFSRLAGPVGGLKFDYDLIFNDFVSLKGPILSLVWDCGPFLLSQHWMRSDL